jgi:hypothetical protein
MHVTGKRAARCAIALVAMGGWSCSTLDVIDLDQDTTTISGWLDAGYEYMLLPTPNIEDYDRFPENRDELCVTLIPKSDEDPLSTIPSGSRVTVTGSPLLYDALESGDDNHDQLLSKRYYNGRFVGNSCYRDYVFLVTGAEVTE